MKQSWKWSRAEKVINIHFLKFTYLSNCASYVNGSQTAFKQSSLENQFPPEMSSGAAFLDKNELSFTLI